MRLAVISDIHANLEALRAVLADLQGQAPDLVYSLGDNLGYGPEPEAVVDLVRAHGIPSVLGNHELGLVDEGGLAWFNPSSRRSLEITRRLVSPATLEYCRGLPASLAAHGRRFVHGLPPDSPTRYLFEARDRELARIMAGLPEPVCFVGHTHELGLVILDPAGQVQARRLPIGRTILPPERRALVNAGSVGQPRDGDNRAKYLIHDDADNSLEVRAVTYDIAKTVKAILDLGLPEFNATRLW